MYFEATAGVITRLIPNIVADSCRSFRVPQSWTVPRLSTCPR